MKVWLLAAIVLMILLLQWRREKFQSTDLIKPPPYSDADYARFVDLMDPALITALRDLYKKNNPKKPLPDPGTSAGKRDLVSGNVEQLFSEFYNRVYAPATEPIKAEQITAFVDGFRDPFIKDNKDALVKLLTSYYVEQPAGSANLPATASQTASAEYAKKTGYADLLATATGTSTGGTSTAALGPTSGGSATGRAFPGSGQLVWGPEYTEMALGDGAKLGTDTTGSRRYPILMGPKPDTSTMTAAGITEPSKSWQLGKDGTLPDAKTLGATDSAQYVGTSRVPGDKDLIPDPYRVAAAFTTATYSTKTEPVPFLTDFSAFQK